MKCKVIMGFLMLLISMGTSTVFAQEWQTKAKLKPLGVIAPDGRKVIFIMWPMTAQRFERKMGVIWQQAGVNYVRAGSWEAFSHVAQASASDLERTVADLVSRVDKLEAQVAELGKRVEKLEKKVK